MKDLAAEPAANASYLGRMPEKQGGGDAPAISALVLLPPSLGRTAGDSS